MAGGAPTAFSEEPSQRNGIARSGLVIGRCVEIARPRPGEGPGQAPAAELGDALAIVDGSGGLPDRQDQIEGIRDQISFVVVHLPLDLRARPDVGH